MENKNKEKKKLLFLESDSQFNGKTINSEIKLIRTIIISFFTVLLICILLYFNYVLLGQFFTTIFLSFIASLAINPFKRLLVDKIENNLTQMKYSICNCYLLKFFSMIWKILNEIFKIFSGKNKKRKSENINKLNEINNYQKSKKEKDENIKNQKIEIRKCSFSFNDNSNIITWEYDAYGYTP